jgi:hypothetical protein
LKRGAAAKSETIRESNDGTSRWVGLQMEMEEVADSRRIEWM